MPFFSFEGRAPQVSPNAWIAPTATLVGDVRVEQDASIWYGAVLRADFGTIIVRRGANVQDGSILHGGAEPVTEIGPGATVGHLCVVHSAFVGAEALIGNGSTVLDEARIGSRALIAAGCTVPPGMEVPDGKLVAGVPARVLGDLTPGARQWVETNPEIYQELARRHAASVREVAVDERLAGQRPVSSRGWPVPYVHRERGSFAPVPRKPGRGDLVDGNRRQEPVRTSSRIDGRTRCVPRRPSVDGVKTIRGRTLKPWRLSGSVAGPAWARPAWTPRA